jgi:uroporphyrinogen decarboxylase
MRRDGITTFKKGFWRPDCFNGCIDSHHVLINGNPDTVRQQTKMVLDIMKPGDGFIAGASHDFVLEVTPLENVLTMFDTIHEYGVY